MSARKMGTDLALAIRVEQFQADELTCDHCDQLAVAFVSTGADPERVPMCGTHAAMMLEVSARTFRLFSGEDTFPASGMGA